MQLLALARGLGVTLLGGTLVGFVPETESPWATVAPEAEQALADAPLQLEFESPVRPFGVEAPEALAAAQNVAPVKAKKSQDHVNAKVFLSVDKLPAGGRCKFAVVLDVEEGWHIYANPPGNEDLIPTTVTVTSQQKLKQQNTKYPKGAALAVEEFDEPVSIYKGEVAIKGEIQAPESAAGKTDDLEFQIEFQVCNDITCMKKTVTFNDKLAIVRPGTPVKQINQKYFAAK